jgi:CheY-like chemotaxis protein
MVLVIEDEPVSRRALQMLLRLRGYYVEAVGSAEEALELIQREGEPDVAVVDINLPGISGIEFRRRLGRMHPHVPCVFMSANEEVNLDHVRNIYKDPALRKPFELASLLEFLQTPSHGMGHHG